MLFTAGVTEYARLNQLLCNPVIQGGRIFPSPAIKFEVKQ